ncbi:hypothetical protein K9B35_12140 [Sphingomonas sp. R647]|uniref:hypothetical protein n=1 Tax=Sphingomonas sp. R647 TaxID=2875233 RepID=UPI001CD63062|nr:hypothetical protein [Sphingomonas sp. R647]MCA1198720.1 hypothetical protein [Sphingomonas sp. R647]
MIARAPIAAGSIAGRRLRSLAIGADFVVPFAAVGLAALDRRAMRTARPNDAAVAGDANLAMAVATSAAGLAAGDRHRAIRIG